MIGRTYLYVKTNWRAWLRIQNLTRQDSSLIKALSSRKREPNVVISFTTYQARIASVPHTLRSIVAGSKLPEGIYLYVNQETHDLLVAQPGSFVNQLIKAGLLHLRVVEDIRSYTKFVYALAEHPEKEIVICDDDVMYPVYWLSELLETRRKLADPKIIVCHRAHRIAYEADGTPAPYRTWEKEVKEAKGPQLDLFPTGTGGVLYPPHSMPALTMNVELFRKYAPSADDIWFWLCALNNGCQFAITGRAFEPNQFLIVPESQATCLFNVNVNQGANDRQMKECFDFFKREAKSLI